MVVRKCRDALLRCGEAKYRCRGMLRLRLPAMIEETHP